MENSEFEFTGDETKFEEKENAAPDDTEEKEVNYQLPHTVKLIEPFEMGSRKVDELAFVNRFNMGMAKHLPAGGSGLKLGHFHPIIEKMTGEVPQLINQLGRDDFEQCLDVVNYFLQGGRTTGE